MDAKQVIDKILSDAQSQADEINSQAAKELSEQKEQFDAQMKEYKDQTKVLAEKAGAEKIEHVLAAARMDIAKQYLGEKRGLLDSVFENAAQQLRELPDEDYLALMGKLISKVVETGNEEVVVDTNETRIDTGFIKKLNRELGPGYHGNLRLSDERQDIGAGFILKRQNIMNNASLGVLMGQARKELEIELAKQLFEN